MRVGVVEAGQDEPVAAVVDDGVWANVVLCLLQGDHVENLVALDCHGTFDGAERLCGEDG